MSKRNSISDLFFCRRCISCGEVLPLFTGTDLCAECVENVSRVDAEAYVLANVLRLRSLYFYDGSIRKALVSFKYYNEAQAGRVLAAELAELIRKDEELMSADFAVNVPNGKYETDRAYNQSEFLCKRVAKACGLKFLPHAMKKKKGIKSQLKCKTRAERKANIKAAFSVEKNVDVRGKTVLIIDDITTTGATLNECAKALIKAGAVKIYAATVAKTKTFGKPLAIRFSDAELTFEKKPTVHYKFKWKIES